MDDFIDFILVLRPSKNLRKPDIKILVYTPIIYLCGQRVSAAGRTIHLLWSSGPNTEPLTSLRLESRVRR